MAPKTYTTKSKNKKPKERDAWTTEMLDRAQQAFSYDTEQRRKCADDMEFAFIPGNQWDSHLTAKRRNKPCYEFNRIRQLIRRITGQQLKNKPEIKVRAVEDNDVDTAEVLNGMIKNIEVQSSAENAYDTAFQWACGGGLGILRVRSEYEHDGSFDQCLRIEALHDPMTAFCDPSARKFDRSDARYWFITEMIPQKEYQRRWPNADVVDFNVTGAMDNYDQDWFIEDEVRIAEYWYKDYTKKTIYQLSDGSIVDAADFDPVKDELANPKPDETGQTPPPITVTNTREVDACEVYSCMVSGAGKLEEPVKWGGSMIPIVPQWGDFLTLNGKQYYCGMTRYARDAQVIHNFEMSSMVEVVAKLPNNPLKATPAMVKGLESYYERLGYDDPPVLLFNPDPQAPGGSPQREPMSQLPAALANLSVIATDEMKAVTGVYDASLGAQGNEQSGRAILARQSQGDVVNFVYTDNQVKALKRLGEILVDAIPQYYDAEREMRILGEDLAEKYVKINHAVQQPDGTWVVENDLSRGKYDVVCTVGKSFDTARMELAETAQAIAQTPGPMGALGQYMLLKSLDVPGIDEMVKAMRRVLIGQGLLQPGENDDPPPPPPPPNPKDVADAQHRQAQAQLAGAKAQEISAMLPAKIEQTNAKTAEMVSKIPGNEAQGHQTMIQNAQAVAPITGGPMLGMPINVSPDYTGGY